jgi:hypothetical protein
MNGSYNYFNNFDDAKQYALKHNFINDFEIKETINGFFKVIKIKGVKK